MLMAVNEPYALMVQPDDILISPREVDEHFGTMVCFHPRYALGDHHNYMDKDDFLREMYLDTVGHDEAGMKRYERMVNIVSSRFRHGPKTAIIYHQLEDKIKSIIGTKVQINAKSNKKGRIEIEYYSEEDLERIVSLLETIK